MTKTKQQTSRSRAKPTAKTNRQRRNRIYEAVLVQKPNGDFQINSVSELRRINQHSAKRVGVDQKRFTRSLQESDIVTR